MGIQNTSLTSGDFDALKMRDLLRLARQFFEANTSLAATYSVKIPSMTVQRVLREILWAGRINRPAVRRKNMLAQLEALDGGGSRPRLKANDGTPFYDANNHLPCRLNRPVERGVTTRLAPIRRPCSMNSRSPSCSESILLGVHPGG
jgi:hypothetical protein